MKRIGMTLIIMMSFGVSAQQVHTHNGFLKAQEYLDMGLAWPENLRHGFS
jgi:hypothetical protein